MQAKFKPGDTVYIMTEEEILQANPNINSLSQFSSMFVEPLRDYLGKFHTVASYSEKTRRPSIRVQENTGHWNIPVCFIKPKPTINLYL